MSRGEPFLSIQDLRVYFHGRTLVKAVDGVTIEMRRGEVLSLVGESGSGKTSIGRTVVGLAKPTGGRIVIDGSENSFKARKEKLALWRKVQMIFQDPYSTFNPLSTIYDSLATPVRRFGLAKTEDEVRKMVQEALVMVGLDPGETQGKYPRQLSGGQRQRASIARALIIKPEVLIADEPVSMLDVSIRAGILDLIKKLNKGFGVSVIFITHDLAVADYISDRVAVMYKGKMVEIGPVREVIDSPMHPYTELLLRSTPKVGGEVEWSTAQDPGFKEVGPGFVGCNFYPRCPISESVCSRVEPAMVELRPGHWVACHVRSRAAS